MSRLIARRVRSRDQETESTNRRIMRRGSVSTSQVAARAVTESRQWPGGVRVRPGDLTPETVGELETKFTSGRTLTLTRTTTQTITYNSGAGEDITFTNRQAGSPAIGMTVPTLPAAAPSLPADGVWSQTVTVQLGAVPSGTELLVVDSSGSRLWPLGTTWVAAQDHASPTDVTFDIPRQPWDRGLQPAVRIIPPSGETVDVEFAQSTWGIEGSKVPSGTSVWTDFCTAGGDLAGSYETGAVPDGWSVLSQNGTEQVTVEADAGSSTCGQVATFGPASTGANCVIGWDDAGAGDTVEAATLTRHTASADSGMGVFLRVNEDATQGYLISWRSNGSDHVTLTRIEDGSATTVASETIDPVAVGNWRWLRARAEGNRITVKYWVPGDPEPSSPLIDYTDADPLPAGSVGIGTITTGSTAGKRQMDALGVAFGGGTAPTEQP